MQQSEISELIDLTPGQKVAFRNLEKAYKRCLKENILFHQVLESLQAYNGNNVDSIDDCSPDGNNMQSPFFLGNYDSHSIHTVCGWADDDHYFHMKKRPKK